MSAPHLEQIALCNSPSFRLVQSRHHWTRFLAKGAVTICQGNRWVLEAYRLDVALASARRGDLIEMDKPPETGVHVVSRARRRRCC